jgi:archaetidylinositol phosphate synthase
LGNRVSEFRESTRTHRALTAGVEKRLLVSLAERMPRWVNSDHLTALGFAALVGCGFCYWYAHYDRTWFLVATALLAVNWVGDSLDGTLARVRNQQRPRYGFYVDHLCDAVGTLALVAGFAASGYMSWQVAAALLVAYFMMSIEVYLATYALGDFKISYFGFGPTELRIVIAIGTLALYSGYRYTGWLGRTVLIYDLAGLTATFAIIVVFLVTTAKHIVTLYREEPLP